MVPQALHCQAMDTQQKFKPNVHFGISSNTWRSLKITNQKHLPSSTSPKEENASFRDCSSTEYDNPACGYVPKSSFYHVNRHTAIYNLFKPPMNSLELGDAEEEEEQKRGRTWKLEGIEC